VEPPLVPPVDRLGGGQLDLLYGAPGTTPADELSLLLAEGFTEPAS
jgi:hypothetical protein